MLQCILQHTRSRVGHNNINTGVGCNQYGVTFIQSTLTARYVRSVAATVLVGDRRVGCGRKGRVL